MPWLQNKWNRLPPEGKVNTILGLVGLLIAGTALAVQLVSQDSEPQIETTAERFDDPVGNIVPPTANAATSTNEVAAANSVGDSGDRPPPVRQCPSETFASAQGDWEAELICDGQTYTGRLALQFVSAKGLDAVLTFNRSQQDSGDDRDPLTSELHGGFAGDYNSVYLSNHRRPLRTGYPLIELQFARGGLGARELRARVFDIESRRPACGGLTARRASPAFGGRSYPQIVFNRRRPTTPDFDPNDC